MGYKTQDSKRQLRVFLCHASADKPKVRELYRYLRRRGIRPWFDEIDLVGGQDWQVEIPKALATSDAIIICLTKNSVDKEGYIQKEIKFALDKALEMPEGRIFLIPVRFEECEVPFSLSRYQWVDLFDEAGYIRMMRALKFRASQLERTIVELPQKDIEEEKIVLEEAAREKEERETADKATREKLEWEAAEKATREQAERETAERDAREKAEREATEKAMREKVRSDAAEKTRRERAARKSAQMVALKEAFFRSFNSFKLVTPKAKSLLRIGSILGIIFVLFWVGSWAMPNFSSFFPTAQASATLRSISTVTLSPMPPTRTLEPVATPTVTQTSGSTALPTEITDAKGVQMVLVPAGEFTKGSDNDFEQPVAQAYLDAFYMDKYEVTNAHYKSCVDVKELIAIKLIIQLLVEAIRLKSVVLKAGKVHMACTT